MKTWKFLRVFIALGLLSAPTMSPAQNAPPPAGTNTGTAQEPGKADQPKRYQPSNPGPDQRSAPTSTPSGEGPSNGGRPEQEPSRK